MSDENTHSNMKELRINAPDLFYIFTFDISGVSRTDSGDVTAEKIGNNLILDLDRIKEALTKKDIPFFSSEVPYVKKIIETIEIDKTYDPYKICDTLNSVSSERFYYREPVHLSGFTIVTQSVLDIMLFYLLKEKSEMFEKIVRETIWELSENMLLAYRLLENIDKEEIILRKDRKRGKTYVLSDILKRFINITSDIVYLPHIEHSIDIFEVVKNPKLSLGSAKDKIRVIELIADNINEKTVKSAISYFRRINRFIFEVSNLILRSVEIYKINTDEHEILVEKKIRDILKTADRYSKHLKYFKSVEKQGRMSEQSFSEEFSLKYVPLTMVLSNMHFNTVDVDETEYKIINNIDKICKSTKKKSATLTEIADMTGLRETDILPLCIDMAKENKIVQVKKGCYALRKGIHYIEQEITEKCWDIITLKSERITVKHPEIRLSDDGVVSLRIGVRPENRKYSISELARLESRLYTHVLSIATYVWKIFAIAWNDCYERDKSDSLPFKLEKQIKITKSGAVYVKKGDSYKEVIYHKFIMRLISDENLMLEKDYDSIINRQIIGLARSAATAWRYYQVDFLKDILNSDISYTENEIVILTEKGLLINMPKISSSSDFENFVYDILLVVEILGMRKCSLLKIDQEIDRLLLEHTTALKQITRVEELERLRTQFFDITKTKTLLVDLLKIERHVQATLLRGIVTRAKEEFWLDSLQATIKEKINDLDSLVQSTYTMELREKDIELTDQLVNIFDEMRLMQGTLEILEIFIIFVYFVYFAEHILAPFKSLLQYEIPTRWEIFRFLFYISPGVLGVVFGIEYIRHGRSWILKKHIRNILLTQNGEMKKDALINTILSEVQHESELFIGVVEIILRPFERFKHIGKTARNIRKYLCTKGLIEEINHIIASEESFETFERNNEIFVKLID